MRQLDLEEDVIFPGDMVHIRRKWIADHITFDKNDDIVETSYDDQTRRFKIIMLQPNSHMLVTRVDTYVRWRCWEDLTCPGPDLLPVRLHLHPPKTCQPV